MQNKDYYPIPTNGLRLSAHNGTRIQNAPLYFWKTKIPLTTLYQIQACCPIFSSNSYLVFHPFPKMEEKTNCNWLFTDLVFKELDGIALRQKKNRE